MREPHEEILDLLYDALAKIKKLPFIEYDGPTIIRVMVNIETTIKSLEDAKAKNRNPRVG